MASSKVTRNDTKLKAQWDEGGVCCGNGEASVVFSDPFEVQISGPPCLGAPLDFWKIWGPPLDFRGPPKSQNVYRFAAFYIHLNSKRFSHVRRRRKKKTIAFIYLKYL